MAEGRFKNPVVAALAGVGDFFAKQKLADRLAESDRADGKTCLVTGATSGLGFALAVEMARRGARVIMGCRSQIPEAGERVKSLSGSDNVEMRFLDLSRVGSIHSFVDQLARDHIRLDITILNAGVALPGSRMTESGQDEMFMVNYLANVMLTHLLLTGEVIPLSAEHISFRPRIIFISSDSHQGSSAIDYNEFGKYNKYGVSKGISNYSYFKLVLNTYATELSRRINTGEVRIGVNAICPGPVHTNIIKPAPWLLRKILGAIFSVVFRAPAKAALPVVYMAISSDYEGRTNEYLHMFNPKKMDPRVYIPEEGEKLWEESLRVWKEIDEAVRHI